MHGTIPLTMGGIKQAAEIINSSHRSVEQRVLPTIGKIDEQLAKDLENEMFKFEESFGQTVTRLLRTEGWSFCLRGMQRNLVAVAVPIAMTIFLTDSLIEMLHERSAARTEGAQKS